MEKRKLRNIEMKIGTMELGKLATRTRKWAIVAETTQIDGEEILILNIHDIKKYITTTKPEYRQFLTKDDYITQSTSDDRWRTGTLSYMIDIYYWSGWKKTVGIDEESEEKIKKFFNSEEDSIRTIQKVQRKIMDDRLKKKHKATVDRIDEAMNEVSDIPIDFKAWINEVALVESRYIYYEYKPRKEYLLGYCTHCNRDVNVKNAKHNLKGICPNCKSSIIYKVQGKSRNIVDYSQCALVQKAGNSIVIRHFHITKTYQGDYKHPRVSYGESKREILKDKQAKKYEYGEFKQSGERRWCDDMNKYSFHSEALYDGNLETLKDTEYKYSAIGEFATCQTGYKFSVYNYLRYYEDHPFIEYFVKMKLYRLAQDVIKDRTSYSHIINTSGSNIVEMLGVPKGYISQVLRLDVNCKELYIMQQVAKEKKILSDEEFQFIATNNLDIESILEIAKYTTVYQIIKYINKNKRENAGLKEVFIDYADYVGNCKKLGYNLKEDFILFPRNLIEEHDITADLMVTKKNKKYDDAIKEMYEEYKNKYEWEDENYMIIAPISASRIVNEGKRLNHCVGSYLEKVSKKKSVILFVRKKDEPEISFYTLEVRGENIVQCRGRKNRSFELDASLKKAIDKFRKEKLAVNKKKSKKVA